jgi:hypothetical protein
VTEAVPTETPLLRTNIGTQDHLLGLIIDGLAHERARGGDRPLEPRNSRCEAPYRKEVVIRSAVARREASAPSFVFTRHAVGGFKTESGISSQVQGERESTLDPARGFLRKL